MLNLENLCQEGFKFIDDAIYDNELLPTLGYLQRFLDANFALIESLSDASDLVCVVGDDDLPGMYEKFRETGLLNATLQVTTSCQYF